MSIKCVSSLVDSVKAKLLELNNIIESRIILVHEHEDLKSLPEVNLSVDHLARFVECCKANIVQTELLDEELSEICK